MKIHKAPSSGKGTLRNFPHPATAGLWLVLAGMALPHCEAAVVFSFQHGDLRKDGALYGAGASYTGTFDGSVTDNAPANSAVTNTQDRVGNQFRTANANAGSDGQQWSGLFTIDLSELATFILGNPGFTVSAGSFTLTSTGGNNSGGAAELGLYRTQPFTSAATWSTYNGANAWPAPLLANTGGVAGGGTMIGSQQLGGGTLPSATSTAGGIIGFNTSASLVSAIDDALTRPDKTLYLLVMATTHGNADSYASFANNTHATVDSRPELAITLVPEPGAALLGGLGLLALSRRRRP